MVAQEYDQLGTRKRLDAMDPTIYISTFDKILTNHLPIGKIHTVIAVMPDLDSGLWVLFLAQPPVAVKLKLGSMFAGASADALGSIYYVPAHTVLIPTSVGEEKWQIVPSGLQVTVCQNGSGSAAESQTLYLVPGDAVDVQTPYAQMVSSPFVAPGTLTAQVTFDSPGVSGGVGDPWAVALNFKGNGAQDGGAADLAFGPTCQFHGGSPADTQITVKLHKVDNVQSHSVASYQDFQNMTFALTMSMTVDEAGNVSGNAALAFGQTVFTSTIQPPDGFDLGSVNAVGVAVVSEKNSYPSVTATLRSFTLSANRVWLFPPLHPLHPPRPE